MCATGPVDQRNKEFIRLLSGSGWNQARAARELGTTSATISRYVSGEIRPKLTVLRLFAERTGERLDLGDDDSTPVSDSTGSRALSEWEREALAVFGRLPFETRMRIIRGLKEIVEALKAPISSASDLAGPPGLGALLRQAGPARTRKSGDSPDSDQEHRPKSAISPQPVRDPSHSTDQQSLPGQHRHRSGGSS